MSLSLYLSQEISGNLGERIVNPTNHWISVRNMWRLWWALALLALTAVLRISQAGDRDECAGAASQCPVHTTESACATCGCQCPLLEPVCKDFCSVYNYDSLGNQLSCNQTAYRCEKKHNTAAESAALAVVEVIFVVCCGGGALIALLYCAYRVGMGKLSRDPGEGQLDLPVLASATVLGDGYSQLAQEVQVQLPYPPGVSTAADTQLAVVQEEGPTAVGIPSASEAVVTVTATMVSFDASVQPVALVVSGRLRL